MFGRLTRETRTLISLAESCTELLKVKYNSRYIQKSNKVVHWNNCLYEKCMNRRFRTKINQVNTSNQSSQVATVPPSRNAPIASRFNIWQVIVYHTRFEQVNWIIIPVLWQSLVDREGRIGKIYHTWVIYAKKNMMTNLP